MSAVLPGPTAELIAEIDAIGTIEEIAGGDGGHWLAGEGCNNHPFCRGWIAIGSNGVGCINCPKGNTCTEEDHYKR